MSDEKAGPMAHPGVGVGVGAYDGPNTGNLWYDDNEDTISMYKLDAATTSALL